MGCGATSGGGAVPLDERFDDLDASERLPTEFSQEYPGIGSTFVSCLFLPLCSLLCQTGAPHVPMRRLATGLPFVWKFRARPADFSQEHITAFVGHNPENIHEKCTVDYKSHRFTPSAVAM
jgi:hypothetical protein